MPEVDAPLVADMSSTILSRPIDVEAYDVIYAGAQKNIGPAGFAIVIVRRELYGRTMAACPSMFSWEVADKAGSMYNTPPTYSLYLAGLVFAWIEQQGGLAAMAQNNASVAPAVTVTSDSGEQVRP